MGSLIPLLIAVADSSARTAGYYFKLGIFPIGSIIGIFFCAGSMRRQSTSAVCVRALTIFLIGLLVMSIAVDGEVALHWPSAVVGIFGVLFLSCVAVSLVLGIIGLATFDRQRHSRGRAHAIWALSLCSVFVLSWIIGPASNVDKRTTPLNVTPARVESPALIAR